MLTDVRKCFNNQTILILKVHFIKTPSNTLFEKLFKKNCLFPFGYVKNTALKTILNSNDAAVKFMRIID